MIPAHRFAVLAALILGFGLMATVPVSATHTETPCTGVFVSYGDGHSESQQYCNIGSHEPWLELPPPGDEWLGSLHVPHIQVECDAASAAGFGPDSDFDGHVPLYWEVHVWTPPAETIICASGTPPPACEALSPQARVEPGGTVLFSTDPQPGVVVSVWSGAADSTDFVAQLDSLDPFYAHNPTTPANAYTFRAQVFGHHATTECVVEATEIPVFATYAASSAATVLALVAYLGVRRRA